jgi:hypothetical protein
MSARREISVRRRGRGEILFRDVGVLRSFPLTRFRAPKFDESTFHELHIRIVAASALMFTVRLIVNTPGQFVDATIVCS